MPVEVRFLGGQLREASGDGLVAALETAFRVLAALGLLLGLVAVVLELLLGGRAAAGVRLVQLLPVVAAAVVGGTLLGLALPWLLGPALDLRASTAGPGAPVLAPDRAAVGLLVPGAVVLEGVAGWCAASARPRRARPVCRSGGVPFPVACS
ncbi:hypothetical protein [Kitasatospora fiedleri]|uniref:hypothetical protein n=1 Tax=Kitasatospora fiedleri TaxID=2991545 RepID=UPI00249AA769|nr:hypothetical protein [Kitasatospora fiedleri]